MNNIDAPKAIDSKVFLDAPGDAGIDSPPLPSGVFAIPLSTPATLEDGQGFFYTPELTASGTTFLLDLDTGSTDTGIAGSDCTVGCTGLSPLYTAGSNAMMQVSGGSAVVVMASYGDGTGWTGDVYSDQYGLNHNSPTVSADLIDINNASANPAFFQSNAYQGIFGVGRDDLLGTGDNVSYLDGLVTAGVTDAIGIELCQTDGTFWLGGVDPTHAGSDLQFTPMLAENDPTNTGFFYAVNLTAMHLGSANTGLTADLAQGPILDSGTSLFFIPTPTETTVIKDLNENDTFKALFPGQTLTDPTGSGATAGCVTAGSNTTDAMVDDGLPPLSETFGTGSAAITISAPALASYLENEGPANGTSGPDAYCLVMFPGGDAQSQGGQTFGGMIMGDTFLRGFVTEIDIANEQAGFAPDAFCPIPEVARKTRRNNTSGHFQKPRELGRGPQHLHEMQQKLVERRKQAQAQQKH